MSWNTRHVNNTKANGTKNRNQPIVARLVQCTGPFLHPAPGHTHSQWLTVGGHAYSRWLTKPNNLRGGSCPRWWWQFHIMIIVTMIQNKVITILIDGCYISVSHDTIVFKPVLHGWHHCAWVGRNLCIIMCQCGHGVVLLYNLLLYLREAPWGQVSVVVQ